MVLDLSLAQILPEKINKMFLPKKLGFIDVLRTVGDAIRFDVSADLKKVARNRPLNNVRPVRVLKTDRNVG